MDRSGIVARMSFGITGADLHRVTATLDFNPGLPQPLLVARRLHRVDLHFVLVPAGDFDIPVDVVQRDAPTSR